MEELQVKISIVVPVYNVEEYIDECIKSIINQDYNDFEIIIVNDGSTDSSGDMIKKYAELENVKIIHKENGGLSSARNTGLLSCSGDYILFLDSDDKFYSNDVLSSSANKIIQDDLDILIFDYCIWDNQSDEIYRHLKQLENKIVTGKEFYNKSVKENKITSVVWNKMIRKDLLTVNDLTFVDGLIFEDVVYTPTVMYTAKKVMYLPIIGLYYRQRAGSIMSSTSLTLDRITNYLKVSEYLDELSISYLSQVLLNQAAYCLVISLQNSNRLSSEDKLAFKKLIRKKKYRSIIRRSSKLKYKTYYWIKSKC